MNFDRPYDKEHARDLLEYINLKKKVMEDNKRLVFLRKRIVSVGGAKINNFEVRVTRSWSRRFDPVRLEAYFKVFDQEAVDELKRYYNVNRVRIFENGKEIK